MLTHMPSAMHCEGDKHIGQVTTLDYRDSTIATAGSSDCVVFVWDVTEAERALCKVDSLPEPVRLAGHTDVITAVRVDAENGHLYSASVDGSVRIWDRTTGNCVNIVRVGEPVLSMTLTGKGYLLVGCASGRVQAYSAEKGLYLLSFLCHKRHATAVAHWDEGDVLVTGDSGGSLNVWSMKDGSSLGTLPAHDAAVTSVQMDGAKIVSAARDGCVAVSAIDTMRRLYTIQGYTKYLTSAYFDDAKLIADGTNDVVVCHSFDPDAEEST